jgi:hypothetical protein
VVQGLFLNGVDTETAGAAIGVQHHSALMVLPHIAEALFTLFDPAIAGT